MFSWASSHLEKLSNTLAPPPTDPGGRLVYCCQRDDEESAMAVVPELPGAGVVVQASRGQLPIHIACQSSMPNLIRMLMHQPGASWQLRDGSGNTALHAACQSNKPIALDIVKMLVVDYQADVTDRNNQGETPYDVAQLNSVRQYLLPLQLQKETQQALDNGGVGLPAGIDLGGLKITNSHLPPPPVAGMMPGPPISVGMPPSAGPPNSGPQQMFATPMPAGKSTETTTSSGETSAPGPSAAPTSGPRDYALTGSSSAAIYNPAGRRVFKPDGFHSSSSDKRLQEKYGHAPVGYGKGFPPPPSSGSAPPSGGLPNQPASAPPSFGTNPYAGGSTALGANRQAYRRYVAVDPVTGKAMAPQAPSSGLSYSPFQGPPSTSTTPPAFTMFNPVAPSPASCVSVGETGVPDPAGPAASNGMLASTSFPPQLQPQTYMTPGSMAFPPPPTQSTADGPSPSIVVSPTGATPTMPPAMMFLPRSVSNDSASNVFSALSPKDASSAEVADQTGTTVVSQGVSASFVSTTSPPAASELSGSYGHQGANSLFARPPAAGMSATATFSFSALAPRELGGSSTASDVFSKRHEPFGETARPTGAPGGTPKAISTPLDATPQQFWSTEDECLDEIPLSPPKFQPLVNRTQQTTDADAFTSIGMPPPPFSRQ